MSILQQTDDGIYYVEIASIKFGAMGDKKMGMYWLVPKYKENAIKVDSFNKEDILKVIYKDKSDLFRFIFT